MVPGLQRRRRGRPQADRARLPGHPRVGGDARDDGGRPHRRGGHGPAGRLPPADRRRGRARGQHLAGRGGPACPASASPRSSIAGEMSAPPPAEPDTAAALPAPARDRSPARRPSRPLGALRPLAGGARRPWQRWCWSPTSTAIPTASTPTRCGPAGSPSGCSPSPWSCPAWPAPGWCWSAWWRSPSPGRPSSAPPPCSPTPGSSRPATRPTSTPRWPGSGSPR